ncbi:hypothetical protein FQZ97_481770 [compost metagenome]
MGAHGEMLGDLGGGQHRADGEAATQALGAGEDVRGHAVVLVGEQVAATAHAALHLVEHQQCVVLVAQLAGTFQVGLVRRQHAALALHGLQDHGAGLVGDGRLQGLQVVERHMGDALHLRPEAIGIFRLAADGHGEQGAAVEAVGRRDDLVLVRAVDVVGITAGQFERRLVGLGAGVGEEHALGEGGFHQLLGQAQGRFVGEHVGDVPDLARLLGQRPHQRRVRVAQGVHGDAAGEVDQLSTALVPDSRTFATHRNEGGGRVVGHHVLVEIGALHRLVLNGHRSSPG